MIRPFLFCLEAERSHDLIMSMLAAAARNKAVLRVLARCGSQRVPSIPCQLCGLSLPNPLGLAAGLDKDARAFPALAAMGFGWVELGTVTPKPQPGNAKPRIFRVRRDAALINRMGFNSGGLEAFIRNIENLRQNTDAVIGINIGKNASTPIDSAADDYLQALEAVYTLSDYISINISSPNTESLRQLQSAEYLGHLVEPLVRRRDELASHHDKLMPLMLKIAPDLGVDDIMAITKVVQDYGLDGVIATNTTVSRPNDTEPTYNETGGLSGRPLNALSTAVVDRLRSQLDKSKCIIGVGGIENAADVVKKVRAGAEFVQLYTCLIYQGPGVVRHILLGLERAMQSKYISDWASFVESNRS